MFLADQTNDIYLVKYVIEHNFETVRFIPRGHAGTQFGRAYRPLLTYSLTRFPLGFTYRMLSPLSLPQFFHHITSPLF